MVNVRVVFNVPGLEDAKPVNNADLQFEGGSTWHGRMPTGLPPLTAAWARIAATPRDDGRRCLTPPIQGMVGPSERYAGAAFLLLSVIGLFAWLWAGFGHKTP